MIQVLVNSQGRRKRPASWISGAPALLSALLLLAASLLAGADGSQHAQLAQLSNLTLPYLQYLISSPRDGRSIYSGHSSQSQIRPAPCISSRSGRRGVCMFVWECVKKGGEPGGICTDRFMFGGCCEMPEEVMTPTAVPAELMTAAASTAHADVDGWTSLLEGGGTTGPDGTAPWSSAPTIQPESLPSTYPDRSPTHPDRPSTLLERYPGSPTPYEDRYPDRPASFEDRYPDQPSTYPDRLKDRPSIYHDRYPNRPSSYWDRPSSYSDRNKPSSYFDRNKPSSYFDRDKPSSYVDRNKPSSYSDRNKPSISYLDRNKPSSYLDKNKPSYSNKHRPYTHSEKPSGFLDRYPDNNPSSGDRYSPYKDRPSYSSHPSPYPSRPSALSESPSTPSDRPSSIPDRPSTLAVKPASFYDRPSTIADAWPPPETPASTGPAVVDRVTAPPDWPRPGERPEVIPERPSEHENEVDSGLVAFNKPWTRPTRPTRPTRRPPPSFVSFPSTTTEGYSSTTLESTSLASLQTAASQSSAPSVQWVNVQETLPDVSTPWPRPTRPTRPNWPSLAATTRPETTTTTTTTTSTTTRATTTTPRTTTTTTTTTRRPTTRATPPAGAARAAECGVPPLFPHTGSSPETRIVGGKNAPFGGFPWQVSVRRTSFFGLSTTHRCGGALLNEQWVATAGHCVDDLVLSQIRIRVGEYDFGSVHEPFPYQERNAAAKHVHPKYNFYSFEYDLALVKLEKPVELTPNVHPICLPGNDDRLVGENATVTGWGRLSEGGTLPSILQQATVPIMENSKCKKLFKKAGRKEYIPEIFLCAGYESGGTDSCQGDSGGPLQVRGKDGRWFLAGIISWGIGCAEPNLPGVCTRISKFTDWVLKKVATG